MLARDPSVASGSPDGSKSTSTYPESRLPDHGFVVAGLVVEREQLVPGLLAPGLHVLRKGAVVGLDDDAHAGAGVAQRLGDQHDRHGTGFAAGVERGLHGFYRNIVILPG